MTNPPLNPGRTRKSSKAGGAPPRRRAPPGAALREGAAPVAADLAPAATDPNVIVTRAGGPPIPADRRVMIAEAAYYRAERRGFAPGCEQEDWFAAEREVDAALSVSRSALPGGRSSDAERGATA